MIAYKIFKVRKDGSLGSLYCDTKAKYYLDKWYRSSPYYHPKLKFRPGFHATLKPYAPHIKIKKNRAWYKIDVEDYTFFDRPACQGGKWLVCKKMKILEEA